MNRRGETYREEEGRVQEAIDAIQCGQFDKISAAARYYEILYYRLRARFLGRPSRLGRKLVGMRLIEEEDAGLCQYLDHLDAIGLPARLKHVEAFANLLVAMKADSSTTPPQVGEY